MPDTQELLEKAQALGTALAGHATVREYHAAQRAARQDETAQRLLREYQAALDHIGALEAERKPVEPADKQKLRDFERQLTGHPLLKNLMRLQADYAALMAQINSAIDAPLAQLAHPEPTA